MNISFTDIIKELFVGNKFSKSIIGLGLICLWFIGSWNGSNCLALLGQEYTKAVYYFGVLTFLVGILTLFSTTIWGVIKLRYYKIRYPLKNLNSAFYIVSFQGRVCLLDNVRKEIRWIKTWQTAIDLDFVGEWTNANADVTTPSILSKASVETKDGKTLRLEEFKYVGGIHTQGVPGT